MTYRMIAADLDGTLHAEQQPFTPRVRAAVSKAQERGIRVVMATGRISRTALPFARDLGLTSPVICNHGATIHDGHTSALLFQQTVPLDLARQVIAWVPEDITALVCANEEFYVVRASADAVDFVGRYHDHLHVVPDLAQSLLIKPQKIVFVNDEHVSTHLLGELREQFGQCLHVVQSFSRYIEVTHCDVSKASAVAWLAKRWDIPREEVIAIGDQGNDISMIEWAGLGVAMGNAIDSVKALADFVAPCAEEDGAAVVIEKFVLDADG
jgi:Cof subfamily protein (haloacid dehalogenase superfamily)